MRSCILFPTRLRDGCSEGAHPGAVNVALDASCFGNHLLQVEEEKSDCGDGIEILVA